MCPFSKKIIVWDICHPPSLCFIVFIIFSTSVALQEWKCFYSSVAQNIQWLIRKSLMCIYTNNRVFILKSWSCRLMGSEGTMTEKRERKKKRKCTTVMTTQICFASFWPKELSKKHLMLKWGQEKVKRRYMSAVMNIWTVDLKRLAVFMREVARVTSSSLSRRWAALALTTTWF